jgi:nitrite reductase/ring-hydroxylating ferredoxin subunit
MKYESQIIDEIEFVKLCHRTSIWNGKGLNFQFEEDEDMEIALIQYNDEIYCISNICLHRHATELHNGILKDGTVTCPLHGWTYKLNTGENMNRKQGIRSIKTYQVKIINDFIYVQKPMKEIPKWRQTSEDL